ncbi:hypothetical protein QGP82_21365 [Leptothoe sp. LEGE 181152]|nr:hypothetical protein [Leptothoe sp. LEGE 181152]
MNFEKVDAAIEKANLVLRKVKIWRRGEKLSLRGSLPKKKGEGSGNKQRWLQLGIVANPEGVKVALARAQKAESDLMLKQWNWADWEDDGTVISNSAAVAGRRFGEEKQGTIKPQSYDANYREPLAALPNKPLTEELIRSLVLSRHPADSWGRKNDCMVYQALGKHSGLKVDLSDLRGRYKPKPVRSANVPSDKEIEQIWESLKSPGWRWVYGMLATYGLRPHEVFRIVDHKGIGSKTGKISIMDDSKTGGRDVWPLPDQWRHQFELKNVVLPKIRIEGRNNQELGERISQNLCQQKVKKIPHTPYALRHAWAIRSAIMGIPDSIAARWMGHSIAVHSETYHAAIDQLQHESIWARANQLGNSI